MIFYWLAKLISLGVWILSGWGSQGVGDSFLEIRFSSMKARTGVPQASFHWNLHCIAWQRRRSTIGSNILLVVKALCDANRLWFNMARSLCWKSHLLFLNILEMPKILFVYATLGRAITFHCRFLLAYWWEWRKIFNHISPKAF